MIDGMPNKYKKQTAYLVCKMTEIFDWMSSNPPSNYYATGVLNSLHHSYVRGMLFEKLCCFWEEDWSNVTKLILPLQGWILFIMARYFLKCNKHPLPPCIICLLQSITSRLWILTWACKDVHDWSFLNGGTISKDPNSKILRISKWRIHATCHLSDTLQNGHQTDSQQHDAFWKTHTCGLMP